MRKNVLALSLIGLGSLAGCFGFDKPLIPPTTRDHFEYDAGCKSLDDCVVASGGAHTNILPPTTVSRASQVASSNEAVARFALDNDNHVVVTSGVAGTATLQLVDAGGVVYASHDVRVADTAQLAPTGDWMAHPLLLEGENARFGVVTEDAHGNPTVGVGAVRFSADGTLAVHGGPSGQDAVNFSGRAGGGRVTATCPNATASADITIVPMGEITGLTLDTLINQTDDKGNLVVGVRPYLTSARGPVRAAIFCQWTLPGNTAQAMTGSAALLGGDFPSDYALIFKGPVDGDAVCSARGYTASVHVHH